MGIAELRNTWSQWEGGNVMTPDEAIGMLPYWQDRLGLLSWDIKVKMQRHKDMSGDTSMGSVWYQKKHEKAIIYLLDPIDYNQIELDEFKVDAEETLLHELLHLVFLIEERDNYEEEIMEKGINRLARVLVEYRKIAMVPLKGVGGIKCTAN